MTASGTVTSERTARLDQARYSTTWLRITRPSCGGRNSPGCGVLRCDYPVSLTLDELVGLQYTCAFSSLAVLGDRREPYERDIRAALGAAEPSGRFTATLQAQLIIGERP